MNLKWFAKELRTFLQVAAWASVFLQTLVVSFFFFGCWKLNAAAKHLPVSGLEPYSQIAEDLRTGALGVEQTDRDALARLIDSDRFELMEFREMFTVIARGVFPLTLLLIPLPVSFVGLKIMDCWSMVKTKSATTKTRARSDAQGSRD